MANNLLILVPLSSAIKCRQIVSAVVAPFNKLDSSSYLVAEEWLHAEHVWDWDVWSSVPVPRPKFQAPCRPQQPEKIRVLSFGAKTINLGPYSQHFFLLVTF